MQRKTNSFQTSAYSPIYHIFIAKSRAMPKWNAPEKARVKSVISCLHGPCGTSFTMNVLLLRIGHIVLSARHISCVQGFRDLTYCT